MSFRHLSHPDILALHEAVVDAGLTDSRPDLLGGLHPSFVGSIPRSSAPAAQILADLNALNAVDSLTDGTTPLRLWLGNALRLAGPRAESAMFRDALDRLGWSAGTAPAPAARRAQAPSAPAAQSPDLLDTLYKLLAPQLDTLVFKLGAPPEHLAGSPAPLASRAIDLLRWADQQGRRADLARLVAQMVPSAAPAAPPVARARNEKITGAELAEISAALRGAFPTRTALAQMLRFGLDRSLDEIAGPSNLSDTVFELLTAAEANGWIFDLVEIASQRAPGHAALRAVAEKHRG